MSAAWLDHGDVLDLARDRADHHEATVTPGPVEWVAAALDDAIAAQGEAAHTAAAQP